MGLETNENAFLREAIFHPKEFRKRILNSVDCRQEIIWVDATSMEMKYVYIKVVYAKSMND